MYPVFMKTRNKRAVYGINNKNRDVLRISYGKGTEERFGQNL